MSAAVKQHLLLALVMALLIVITFGDYPWWVNSNHPMVPRVIAIICCLLELRDAALAYLRPSKEADHESSPAA